MATRRAIEGYDSLEWDPEIAGGSPVIKGTGITVSLILASLAEAPSPEEFTKRFPELPKSCLVEALRFASDQMFKFRKQIS